MLEFAQPLRLHERRTVNTQPPTKPLPWVRISLTAMALLSTGVYRDVMPDMPSLAIPQKIASSAGPKVARPGRSTAR